MQRLSRHSLRFTLSGLLITLIALMAFGGKAYAAACTAAPLVVNATTTTANCTMDTTYIEPLSGNLTATFTDNSVHLVGRTGTVLSGTANGTITSGAGSTGNPYTYIPDATNPVAFNLNFGTTVVDNRGSLTGWSLAANTTGLPTGSAMQFSTITPACTTTCNPATLSVPATLPVIISNTTTPTPFVGAPDSLVPTVADTGTYTIATSGALTLPITVTAGTVIAAGLTITLNNSTFTP